MTFLPVTFIFSSSKSIFFSRPGLEPLKGKGTPCIAGFQTNKLNRFLDIEAAFPYCNRTIKKACVIGLGSTSVDIDAANVNN